MRKENWTSLYAESLSVPVKFFDPYNDDNGLVQKKIVHWKSARCRETLKLLSSFFVGSLSFAQKIIIPVMCSTFFPTIWAERPRQSSKVFKHNELSALPSNVSSANQPTPFGFE